MTGPRLEIRPHLREVLIDGVQARLGERAFDVLLALARHTGQFVSKSALLDLGWPGLVVEENNLEVQVSALRRLLGRGAIRNASRRGYSLTLTVAQTPVGEPDDRLCFLLSPAPPPSTNLPNLLTSFIGREADLATLLEVSRKSPLLTLTGAGGCGKTRLSIELARALLPRFADGAWLVELGALTDATLVPVAVAKALGLGEAPGKSALELLTGHLASRKALLVFDNAEHLRDACAQLAGTLLQRCAGLMLVISSRVLLGITGERAYRVPSLSMPKDRLDEAPERLARCDAVRLFVDRVQLHRPDFTLDVDNARDAARICVRLDGIPLAIELAAARLRSLSLHEVAERLEQSFELLVSGSRTTMPRHRTLRALIDWSHGLLGAAEQRLFARATAFVHGFSLEAAESVCSGNGVSARQVMPLVTALVDQSLLLPEQTPAGVRFRMLETVWRYASDRLRQSGELPLLQGRHLAWFVAFVDRAEGGLKGAEQSAWLNRLEDEHDNLRAALRVSLETGGLVESGLKLVSVLWRFWSNRGHCGEGIAWVQRLLQALPDTAPSVLRAKALHGAGVMAHTLCNYASATEFHENALALRRAACDAEGMADSLHCLSAAAMVQGRYAVAEHWADECLALRRRLGNPRSLAGSLNNVAGLAATRGDLHTAAPLYEEAVRLHRASGNNHGVALGLVNLGVMAASLGDHVLAVQRLDEALDIHRSLGDGRAIAMDLVHLGQVALERSDLEAARAHYRECLSIVRDQGDALCAVELLQGSARLALAQGRPREAARLYGAAERRREDIGAPIEPVDRPLHETRVGAVRAALGDASAFASAWRQGRLSSIDTALHEAQAQALI